MASLRDFYHRALASQPVLHWMQQDLAGTVALLSEQSIPMTCFLVLCLDIISAACC